MKVEKGETMKLGPCQRRVIAALEAYGPLAPAALRALTGCGQRSVYCAVKSLARRGLVRRYGLFVELTDEGKRIARALVRR